MELYAFIAVASLVSYLIGVWVGKWAQKKLDEDAIRYEREQRDSVERAHGSLNCRIMSLHTENDDLKGQVKKLQTDYNVLQMKTCVGAQALYDTLTEMVRIREEQAKSLSKTDVCAGKEERE